MADEQCHERVILVGVHPLLEVHEALGKPYRLVIHIVWTVCLFAALRGIDEFQERTQLLIPAISQLPQAAVSHWAIAVEAERIA